MNINKTVSQKVVIVGGGIAGLACAKKIKENGKAGIEVTILEAKNRIGGRVFTESDEDGQLLEIGANWIHEWVAENPLFGDPSLKGVFGDRYSVTVWEGKKAYVFDPGNSMGRLLKKIEEVIYKQQVAQKGGQFPSISLKEITDRVLSQEIKDLKKRRIIKIVLSEIQKQDWAVSSEKVSYQGLKDKTGEGVYQFREFQGEDFFVVNGMSRVINRIAKGLFIKKGARVTEISQVKKGFTVTYHLENQIHKIFANHVVVTLPLGVLKTKSVAMPLNKEKTRALSKLKMSSAMKIILKFNRPFWDEGKPSSFWIVICGKNEEENHVFFNLHKAISSTNTLIGWAVGDWALRLKNLSEREIKRFYINILQKRYPDCCLENLKTFKCVSWDGDPLTKGAYTYIPVGVSPKQIKTLATPLGNLHFAGEHTSEFLGTLHGAFLSGERAASEIIFGPAVPT